MAERMAEETAKREAELAAEAGLSKSERIRRYMKENPEARNVDIAEALGEHGVTAADVASVKTQLKKKEEKRGATHVRSGSNGSNGATKTQAINGITASADAAIEAQVGLDVLEDGMDFIRKAGGMNEAQHILNVIRRIRAM
jgi:hypothetical protein